MIQQPTAQPLILVDGSSYLFRAFHALPPLTNSKGLPTGAIYGVLNMLRRLLKDYSPSHMAVVFDSKEPTFRKELYPAYKAQREVMPNDLQIQISPLHAAIRALGLPLVIVPGVEADDIIATLAKEAAIKGMKTVISTGDKDLAQIVDENISLINTMNNTQLDTARVKEKFGVFPNQMVDFLALVGDSVDNIPGVAGVGPKTAAKWLVEYQNLNNLIEHANMITGKVGENLRQHLQELPLARQLVTVKDDIPLACKVEDLTVSSPKQEELIVLFTDLEFKNWLTEISGEYKTTHPQIPLNYTTLLNESEFNIWLQKLQSAAHIVINVVASNLNPMMANLVGIAFAVNDESVYIPLTHDYLGTPLQLNKNWVLSQLQPLLSDPQKTIIGHNLKYNLQILANENIVINTALWDIMLASYILNSAATRHDLNTLTLKYLQQVHTSYEEIAGKGAKQLTFNKIPLDKASHYAAEQVNFMSKLYAILNEKLQAEPELCQVFDDIEMQLMPILQKIERHGVLIDINMLSRQGLELHHTILELEKQVHLMADETFNLSSPKQLQTILFDKLKLPTTKKTPTGQSSTAETVLQELASTYEIARLILEYRTYSKLKSTYVDRLPEQINPRTGRVHTSYQQTGTVTGRLSSKDPNLQNIPIRSPEGRKIRQAFVAPPHYTMISADYSQVELRIMAHLAQDPGLLDAFAKEQDIHTSTAAEVFGIPLEQVTLNQRRSAKVINFGLMYGMSSFGLAQQLNMSRNEAQKYIDIYFNRYPKVHEFMEQARQIASKQGYVTTLYGRRVMIPDIQSNNTQRRLAAERAAINAPLQGSAADIIKLAMIQIDQSFLKHQLDAYMIMQVHDELVFEVADSILDKTKNLIKTCMENVIELSVPLAVDIGVGSNWDEAH